MRYSHVNINQQLQMWLLFWLRLLAGIVVACILPSVLLWSDEVRQWQFEEPQKHSFWLSVGGVCFGLGILHILSKYPGQKSTVYHVPVVLLTAIGLGLVIILSRISYSVYYLAFSLVLAVGFLFGSALVLQRFYQPAMGYIPLGRCRQIDQHPSVRWQMLSQPAMHEHELRNVQGIVADLSSNELDDKWQRFLAQQTISGMPVYNYLQVFESLTGRSPIQHLHENNLGALHPSMLYVSVKRVMDILLVVMFLPITLPIMLLTWSAIRADSKGKAIFSQTRIGQGGKPFTMYKFRSMYAHAPAQNQLMTQTNDVRITRVGRVIRKLRIDELPQFYNVLKGDMSLIGPRPELPNMVAKLDQEIPFYIYRQIVKPGISGWAQVMQGDGHVEDIKTKLEYDFYYIKNFSFSLDFLIVVKTVQTMLTGFGAR